MPKVIRELSELEYAQSLWGDDDPLCQVVSMKEAASIAGKQLATVRIWCWRGLIKARLTEGGHYLVNKQSLLDWIEQNER